MKHTHLKSYFRGFSRGFTLIELIVVIGIIAVLSSLLFTNFASARERTRDVKRKSDLEQIKKTLRLYYNDYQRYPASTSDNKIQGCGADQSAAVVCEWGTLFSAGAGPTIYTNQLPQDPVGTKAYRYELNPLSDEGFSLSADLENGSDDSATKSQLACGISASEVVAKVYMVCPE